MSLFEDLEREARAIRAITPGCKTCLWLVSLDDRDRAVAMIDQWYEDELPHKNLWRILRDNGFPGSEASLRRHHENCALNFRGQSDVA